MSGYVVPEKFVQLGEFYERYRERYKIDAYNRVFRWSHNQEWVRSAITANELLGIKERTKINKPKSDFYW